MKGEIDRNAVDSLDDMPERPDTDAPAFSLPRPSRRGWRRMEIVLWSIAAVSALFLISVGGDRAAFSIDAEKRLEAMRWAGPEREAAAPQPFLARLEIPSISLSALVVDGVDERTLLRAVGRLPKSALPGATGNVALAGHRDTDFRALQSLRRGELIRLRTYDGEFAYEVEWIRIVTPDAVEVVAPTDYPALTLVTCYPFRYVGRAPKRFVVRAREVERPDSFLARS